MPADPSNTLEGIAIIGMAGRFPGAPDIDAFWNALTEGRETITTFDRSTLPAEEPAHDADYVPRRGILEKPEWFDAAFFNISPREAEAMDPQQRVFLEVAWHALENAGCDPQQFPGSIGVFAGMSNNSWLQHRILHNTELRQQVGYENAMICNEKDYLATRTAYKLNLRGPALNIYTACSTSLVAVCQAVQALQSFQCDAALAGGISIKWPQERGFTAQEGSIYSPDGHCRPYDAAATGTVFSNGAGVVVLKRLEDAVRDGDHIWAVIKGAALNNDGADKVSFTAPSVDGHAEVISLAHALAGFEPDTLGYVEGHGTATPIGDPIEVAGLTKAFRHSTERTGFCGLGSLKSNMGHMDAASGVAGLIKATLAVHHAKLPPTLHFKSPNPALMLETTPFFIVDKLQNWNAPGPRRAGVSSFGVGGTNAHVVLEECGVELTTVTTEHGPQVLTLSAKSPAALDTACENLAAWLETHDAPLADVAWTLQTGRRSFTHRRALVAADKADAISQLRAKSPAVSQDRTNVPSVLIFPGQGAQHLRMGAETYAAEPVFREAFDACAALFMQNGIDLHALLKAEEPSALHETRHTQPALFAVEYALALLLKSWGLKPAGMLGHSIGEYVAATLAGTFTLEDAVKLVAARGRIMFSQPAGSMLAVRLPETEVAAKLPGTLDIATINAPGITLVAGPSDEITAFAAALEQDGISATVLKTSHAFHSRMMDGALEEFRAAFDGITLHEPENPWISNVTGKAITAVDATSPDYWVRHLRHAVRFADGIATLAEEGPCVFIECGPGTSFGSLIRQHPAAKDCECVSLFPPAKDEGAGECRALMTAIGKLWMAGVTIDWKAIHNTTRRRVPLPGYPFERQRYCPDAALPPGTIRDGEGWLYYGAAATSETAVARPSRPCEEAHDAAMDSQGRDGLAMALPAPVISRADHLTQEIRGILHRSSGIDIATADPATSFLDLGFDSLFLTQASLALKKHFGVKITFRQLMEQQDSMAALAAWLDEKLPAGQFMPVAPAPQAAGPAASHALASAAPVASGSVEDRLARIEAALGRLTGEALPQPASTPASQAFTVRVKEQTGSGEKKIAFGPFRPMEKTPAGSLTPQQQAHLDKLIADYVARYPKTRAFTAEHRPVFADPRAVGGFNPLWKEMVFPAVTDRSEGAYLHDIDGNQWIDVVHGFGSGFFGHKPAFVVEAIKAQLDRGYEIGPTCPIAGEVAKLVCEFSGKERVAFCNTGSEALMAAIRVSRTITGRDRIAMFAGAYHGIFDEVLARPLVSNGELRTIPIAPGIPESAQANIIVLEYGHPESLEIIKRHAHEIAAVLVEPVPSRRPDIAPVEFVQELRGITAEAGTALVFDEVVLGFRTHPQGAQHLFGISADLVSYGKVIGGGMPLGVLAGTSRFMDALDGGQWQYGDDSAPEVGVTFFAGTFIRHPLTMAAARAVLHKLKADGPALQTENDAKAARFVDKLNALFAELGVPVVISRYSSLWMLHPEPSLKHFSLLFYHLRLRGIHIWEGRGNFVSLAHTDADLEKVLVAFRESILALQAGGFLPNITADETPAAASRRVSPTPAQLEMLFASQYSKDAELACHEQITLVLDGPLQRESLTGALNALIARHECLRAGFDVAEPAMIVTSQTALAPGFSDLTTAQNGILQRRIEAAEEEEFLKPFDLSSPPLLRALLLRTGAHQHRLILTVHHIVCDGWSMGVLMHELPILYREACGAAGGSLPEAPRFSEYAEERRRQRANGDFAASAAWWQQQLDDAPAPLALPSSGPRDSAAPLEAAAHSTDIPPALAARIRSFCSAQRVTPYVLLLTAWNALLTRLSGSTDMVIGTPMAGQSAAGVPGLVGHAVQFLPLRLKTAPGATFLEHLHSVRESFLAAQEHLDCTLGELLDRLPHCSAGDRRGFVCATFTLEPAADFTALTDGLTGSVLANAKRRHLFDLSCFVYTTGEQFRVSLLWHKSLCSREVVSCWLDCWFTLLGAGLEAPEQRVASLPWLGAAQRKAVVHDFNEAAGCEPFPQRCIHELFEEVAARKGGAAALIQEDRTVTYAELNARANRLAWHLRSLGVQPDQPIAIMADKSVEYITGILAILKAGGAYVPVDADHPPERIAAMLRDCESTLLLTANGTAPALPHNHCTVVPLEAHLLPAGLSEANPPCVTTPAHLAYIVYTSGSTGVPKGSPALHRGVVRLVRNQNYAAMDEQQTYLLASALSFDASTFELWAPLLNGGRLALLPAGEFSLAALGAAIARHGVTTLWLTSGLFSVMVDERLEDLRPLRQLLTGGDVVSAAHAARMLRALPHIRLINCYGPTENTTFTTCHTVTQADCVCGVLPIGRPIAHTRCCIVDQDGQPVPPGVTGELLIGGAGLARGYWNRSELTAEKFIPDTISGAAGELLYRTGDLCRWRTDGIIEFLGRADRQIKVNGFRIEPSEVEQALMQHPSVQRCCVAAHGTETAAKRLIAYAVVDSTKPVSGAAIREFAALRLPAQLTPACVMVIPELPVTKNGKVDLSALPAPDGLEGGAPGTESREQACTAPLEGTETELAAIWKTALGRNHIGRESDFFAAGGTSLMALSVMERVYREFGVKLPLGVMMESPRLADFAARVEAAAQRPAPHSPITCIQPQGGGTPLFLLHGGDGGALFYRSLLPKLGRGHPVWVIESPAITDDAWLLAGHSVQSCAAEYLKLIRSVHPSGPVIVGGYSYGGVVAYEMCQLLRASGSEPELLILFDTENPANGPRELSLAERIAAGWRLGGGSLGSKIKHLANRFTEGLRSKSKYEATVAEVRRMTSEGHAAQTLELRTAQIRETHVDALNAWEPSFYDGAVVLFRSDAVSDKYERTEDYNWLSTTPALRVVHVGGDHLVLFEEPWVSMMAEKLHAELAALRRESGVIA